MIKEKIKLELQNAELSAERRENSAAEQCGRIVVVVVIVVV